MAFSIPFMVSVVKRNFQYLRQQSAAAFHNSSVVVKSICCLSILSYFLSFSDTAVHVICVTPGFLLPPNFWVWTAFTHCFMETTICMLLADVTTIGLCGKLLEPLWGAMEMLSFFAIVNTATAFFSVMFYIIIFTITSDPRYLFAVRIHGLAGYCAAVSVAVKQSMPDHVILSLPIGKLRNRNVPLSVLLFSLVLWSFGVVHGTYPVMFTSGLFTAWLYLRFYQRHSNGTVGDMADGFTCASFFPNVLQPPLKVVSNAIFEFFVHIKICKKPVRKYNVAASAASITLNIPGTESHDAERRRQIALKALSERLSKVEPVTWQSTNTQDVKVSNKAVSITMPPMFDHQSAPVLPSKFPHNTKPPTAKPKIELTSTELPSQPSNK